MNYEELRIAYNGIKHEDSIRLLNIVEESCSNILLPAEREDVTDIDLTFPIYDYYYNIVKDIDHLKYLSIEQLRVIDDLLKSQEADNTYSWFYANLHELENITRHGLDVIDILEKDNRIIAIFNYRYTQKDPNAPEYLLKLCIKAASDNVELIKKIIHDNPNYTTYTMEVINLIGPVVAQKFAGIPALAVVGAITLLCKQGITKFLKS